MFMYFIVQDFFEKYLLMWICVKKYTFNLKNKFAALRNIMFHYYFFTIESCTEHKQNIVNIMVQRSAPSNK